MMQCWKCKQELEDLISIGFRSACTHCHSDLHVCKNCKYHAEDKPNECSIPDTDPVRDRGAANFCDSFRQGTNEKKVNHTTKSFDSLFKD